MCRHATGVPWAARVAWREQRVTHETHRVSISLSEGCGVVVLCPANWGGVVVRDSVSMAFLLVQGWTRQRPTSDTEDQVCAAT